MRAHGRDFRDIEILQNFADGVETPIKVHFCNLSSAEKSCSSHAGKVYPYRMSYHLSFPKSNMEPIPFFKILCTTN